MAKAGKKSFIMVSLAACLVSSLFFFTALDNRLFDVFLRFLKPLKENEKVIVLTLDDSSMELAGGFPFRREVMADVVVLLKELGVDSIVFDLSYLDESAFRFDRKYAEDVLIQQYQTYGIYSLEDMLSIVPLLGRDVDEYFAGALAFSGNSWLTLIMIPAEDVIDGSEIVINPAIDSLLAEYIAADNINIADAKIPKAAGVIPTIPKLLSRARGAGTVNANPDSDGLRRRVDLIWTYKGNHYMHQTLAAIKDKLGFTSIDVTNKAITLNIKDGSRLHIPRDHRKGKVLVRWPNKSFNDYNTMSLFILIEHTILEQRLANNLAIMDYNGLFYYWDSGPNPFEYYLLAEEIKNETFAQNSEATEDWLITRENFFNSLDTFLMGGAEAEILADVSGLAEVEDLVQLLFESTRELSARLKEIRNEAAVLNGSFSIIGSTATSMEDFGLITFEENYPNVGTYAVLANMLLSGDFVKDAHWIIPAITALLLSLLIGYFVSRFDTHLSIITGLSGIILLCASFAGIFIFTRVYLGLVVPLAATSLTFITIMVTKFFTANSEKAFLHSAFSRYLAPEIISEFINDPGKLNLGGEKREMTAIFTDIRGFSTISEQLDPVQLVKLLNRYLTTMSNIVMQNLGTIDKYEGDAIIAFFGAPSRREDHASLACRSAIAIKAAEKELNKTVVSEGFSPVPLFTRIGINSGEMVVGNMGAEDKMNYTIMGNAVNLAARLEGVNKQYNTGGILISEYTREKTGDEFLLRRLDRVRVVGINTPLRLYEVINDAKSASVMEKKIIKVWEQAIDLYEKANFREAYRLFAAIIKANPLDKVAELYAQRCTDFHKTPPPEGWDAVRNLTEK